MSSKDNHKNNLKKIAYAGVLAALVFVVPNFTFRQRSDTSI